MKCLFLIVTHPLNPMYSEQAAKAAEAVGAKYDVPRHLTFGPGYVVEDPQAWIHCCPGDMNSPPIAEPADDECRAKVKQWMEVNRPAGIAQIKAQLEQIDLLQNDEDKGRLLQLGDAYGLIGGGRTQTATQNHQGTDVPRSPETSAASLETATTAADESN